MQERVDHGRTVFLNKVGAVPENFDYFSLEVIWPDEAIYTGSEYRIKANGAREFFGEERQAVVTKAEIDQEKIRYENETGNCAECCGTGEVFESWNHKTGTHYETCGKCGGAGVRVPRQEQLPLES